MAESLVCQQNQVVITKTPCLLQPLDTPCQHWEEVSMDFITGLPKSKGKNVIMVLFDRLTRYAHICALSHPFKLSTLVAKCMDIAQMLHGNMKIIVSARDLIFTRKICIE